jgi:transposase-like protein
MQIMSVVGIDPEGKRDMLTLCVGEREKSGSE